MRNRSILAAFNAHYFVFIVNSSYNLRQTTSKIRAPEFGIAANKSSQMVNQNKPSDVSVKWTRNIPEGTEFQRRARLSLFLTVY